MDDEKEFEVNEVSKRKGTTDYKALEWLAGIVAPKTKKILKDQSKGEGFNKKMEDSI